MKWKRSRIHVQRTFINRLGIAGTRSADEALCGIWGREGDESSWLMIPLYVEATSRRIVKLLKARIPKSMLQCQSALAYPCFYGIDIQSREERLPTSYSKRKREIIGADSWPTCPLMAWLILLVLISMHQEWGRSLCSLLRWEIPNTFIWLRRTLFGKLEWADLLLLGIFVNVSDQSQ